jgi:hypothetical protein
MLDFYHQPEYGLACWLSEFMSDRPFLAVAISTTIAGSVDVTSRAGWIVLGRLAVAFLSSGLEILGRKTTPDDSDAP